MKRHMQRRLLAWLTRLGMTAPLFITGCASTGNWWNIDNCATIPPGAQPAPLGTYVHRFQDVQAAKAEADDFVIYKYEWRPNSPVLSPFGMYHINEIIKRLPFVPFPVMIQVNEVDGQLNEARRCAIVQALTMNGIPDAETRVILGFPEAEGLFGEEAENLYPQLISDFNPFFGAGLGGNGLFGGGFGGGIGSPFGAFNGNAGIGGLGVNYGGFGGFRGFAAPGFGGY
jgi:hypothetical protein